MPFVIFDEPLYYFQKNHNFAKKFYNDFHIASNDSCFSVGLYG